MRKVLEALALEALEDNSDVDEELANVATLEPQKSEKKKEKKKKRKSEAMDIDPEVEREASPLKKRKKERGEKEHKKERKEKKKDDTVIEGPVCVLLCENHTVAHLS